MSHRDLKRNRLKANSGSVKQVIHFAPVDFFTTIAGLPNYTPETADHNVADLTERDAIVTPGDGEISYVQSNQLYYKYVAASSSWVRAYQSVITAAHVFPADKGFFRVEATKNKRGFEFSGPDDFDVTGFEMMLNFSVPGLDPGIVDFINKSGLESFIVIVETAEGRMIQLGDANNPANLKVSGGGTGTERLNYKGLELQVSYDGDPAFYEGAATLDLMTD
jgi:hypothetical protein